ncbi:GyrI-like domain-containing protein [Desulfosporosinus sp. SB140]|uniref:GyrI-like domain-containing protein n=1 Tax=Desulfosporosinus paludis TaxID=3115649 RepID=UPI00388F1E8A
MDKLDYKKDFKELYLPKKTPVIVTVPDMEFIMLDGSGDPNGEEFALATAALYSLSYAVKMSYKRDHVPSGYYDYTVFPLEGVWDLVDKTLPPTEKSNFRYKIMIRQPDFLTVELFEQFREETNRKKPNPYLNSAEFGTIAEGLCCQMLHIGSYDQESESFARMDQYCKEQGYQRRSLKHRELYLSDPRKTEPHKLKTVLRYQVENT